MARSSSRLAALFAASRAAITAASGEGGEAAVSAEPGRCEIARANVGAPEGAALGAGLALVRAVQRSMARQRELRVGVGESVDRRFADSASRRPPHRRRAARGRLWRDQESWRARQAVVYAFGTCYEPCRLRFEQGLKQQAFARQAQFAPLRAQCGDKIQ